MATQGDGWTDAELRACVEVYVEIDRVQRTGGKVVKKHKYVELTEGPLGDRSWKSVERRMGNISAVLLEEGRPWADGLKPWKNVGTDIKRRIRGMLIEAGAIPPDSDVDLEPTPDRQTLENRTRKARRRGGVNPRGSLKPRKVTSTVESYHRDPTVRAAVLEAAEGHCDLCREPAPFEDRYGDPFLECHHVHQLADGGADTVENAVALCPNCHRLLHYGGERQSAVQRLFEQVPRLTGAR